MKQMHKNYNREKSKTLTSYLLLALALLFIVTGIIQGDFGDIRNRSINICLECIGIG